MNTTIIENIVCENIECSDRNILSFEQRKKNIGAILDEKHVVFSSVY